jgi:hypothetical protein
MTDLRERMVAMTVRAGRGWEEMIERDSSGVGRWYLCRHVCEDCDSNDVVAKQRQDSHGKTREEE